jgi:menaquinol-cytochrome c reductase iron-sulfur subunit
MTSRRKVLEVAAVGTGLAAAGLAVAPLVSASLEPVRESPSEAPWVDVAGEKEIAGTPFKATLRVAIRDGYFVTLVDAGAVWLQRNAARELFALSAACPHLGCGIGLSQGGFTCPCHESHFSLDGAAVKGPAPRSMDPLPLKVENGRVLVQALRFAPGVKVRRPA